MNEDNSDAIEGQDDLDLFSSEFFGTTEKEETPPADADDTSSGDAPAPEEEELASDEQEEDNNSDEDGDEDVPVEKPKKKTAQERINDITREKHEALRKAEALEARIAELERRREEPQPEKVVTTGAPTPEDTNEDGSEKYPLGEYDPAFIRDSARFTVRQELEADRLLKAEEDAARNQQDAVDKATETFKQKAVDGNVDISSASKELAPIFTSVDRQYGEYLSATIMMMEKGPEVFRYLADHLDEAEEIVASGPTAATIRLGRLEAKFLSSATAKPRVSQAPEPPPRNRGTNGKFDVADDTDDLDAFADKFFNKRK